MRMDKALPLPYAKVFWDGGAHEAWVDCKGNRVAPPLSKLHSAGKDVLQQAGWRKATRNTTLIPVFAWAVRQGSDWDRSSDSAPAPPIRQLPQRITDLLDDKRELQLTLEQGILASKNALVQKSLLVLHSCSESLLVLTFLRQGGVAHLAPETHVEIEAVIGSQSEGGTQCPGKREGDSDKTGQGHEDEVWFLKHRRGVKG